MNKFILTVATAVVGCAAQTVLHNRPNPETSGTATIAAGTGFKFGLVRYDPHGGLFANAKVGAGTSKLSAFERRNSPAPINGFGGILISDAKPMMLSDPRTELTAPPLNTSKDAESFPAHWKSVISGAEWAIRKQNDGLYLERLLSDAALREEHFTSLELHREKKGYRGTERQVIGGAYIDRSGREVSYKCIFDWPAELTVLTESRVEIRVLSPPDNSTIDFRKCAVTRMRLWHTAVWVLE